MNINGIFESITDGKPHILDNEYGYVIEMCNGSLSNKIDECRQRFISMHAQYIYRFDKEYAISIIEKHINEFPPHQDVEFICKPSNSYLTSEYSVAMKFKRLPNDEEFFNA